MTDPAITDEELAYWEAAGIVHAPENHLRLIAALRAERDEVARLTDELRDERLRNEERES